MVEFDTKIMFSLSYSGETSDDSQIDFYDISQALVGFQRSLALTTHLVLNNEVITQAPSLKGAKIFLHPPEEGSWKIAATVIGSIATGAYFLGTAPRDTVLGHLVTSAYDYVISETLGFHVDFDRTLGEQYEELNRRDSSIPSLDQTRLDSVIEKCESAIKNMHRPIVDSETASRAKISANVGRTEIPFRASLTPTTYEYLHSRDVSDRTQRIIGQVSSYNINTYKGRIYVRNEGRPIPFELVKTARTNKNIRLITESLSANARVRQEGAGEVICEAYLITSRTGILKALLVVDVRRAIE